MTTRSSSFLYTRRTGPEDGIPWLLLHDRYGNFEDAEALAGLAGPGVNAIAVRGARTQTTGGFGQVHSHYWFFGPKLTPELSTLGDALFQLEKLVLDNAAASPTGKLGMVGKGEGGVVALVLALIWPEKFSRVIAIDAGLPTNLADIPIDPQPLGGLDITLIAPVQENKATTIEALLAAGATLDVSEKPAD